MNIYFKKLLINLLSSKPVSALASYALGQGTPIFMLHRTYPDNTPGKLQTPSYLRRCLSYLKKNGYHFVSVTEILTAINGNRPLPRKSVAFTIDDGFSDQAELAAPVFIEFNCPVTIFLITDFIDGKIWPWFSKVQYLIQQTKSEKLILEINQKAKSYILSSAHDKEIARKDISEKIKKIEWSEVNNVLNNISDQLKIKIPDTPPDGFQPMSWSVVRELEEACISFGPHTITHPILAKVDDETANMEITGSWEYLKTALNSPAPVFCYPNGESSDFSEREIKIIKQTDMLGAVSTIPMQLHSDIKLPDIVYTVPRYSLPDNFTDFIMYSSWLEFAKEKLRGQKI